MHFTSYAFRQEAFGLRTQHNEPCVTGISTEAAETTKNKMTEASEGLAGCSRCAFGGSLELETPEKKSIQFLCSSFNLELNVLWDRHLWHKIGRNMKRLIKKKPLLWSCGCCLPVSVSLCQKRPAAVSVASDSAHCHARKRTGSLG